MRQMRVVTSRQQEATIKLTRTFRRILRERRALNAPLEATVSVSLQPEERTEEEYYFDENSYASLQLLRENAYMCMEDIDAKEIVSQPALLAEQQSADKDADKEQLAEFPFIESIGQEGYSLDDFADMSLFISRDAEEGAAIQGYEDDSAHAEDTDAMHVIDQGNQGASEELGNVPEALVEAPMQREYSPELVLDDGEEYSIIHDAAEPSFEDQSQLNEYADDGYEDSATQDSGPVTVSYARDTLQPPELSVAEPVYHADAAVDYADDEFEENSLISNDNEGILPLEDPIRHRSASLVGHIIGDAVLRVSSPPLQSASALSSVEDSPESPHGTVLADSDMLHDRSTSFVGHVLEAATAGVSAPPSSPQLALEASHRNNDDQ